MPLEDKSAVLVRAGGGSAFPGPGPVSSIAQLAARMEQVPDPHPLALLVPGMGNDEYTALVDDIARNGLLHPIVLYEDKILDGRHRARACVEAGRDLLATTYDGDTPLAHVVSLNLSRRHLTGDQRAALGAQLEPALAEEARKRQAHGETAPGKRKHRCAPDGAERSARPRRATDEAAVLAGSSGRQVQRAKVIKKADAGLLEQVLDGTLKLAAAERQLRSKERARRLREEPPPAGEYTLILADPPWTYRHGTTTSNRRVAEHYETMELDDIKALPVPAAKDAVLLLWATCPLLLDAIDVMLAWGFEYKSQAVWVKDNVGTGYWFRQRHELLLLGVKGNASPPTANARQDSVIDARRGKHSAKPLAAYDLIETMFPGLDERHRIELFGREARPGWKVWGNEVSS